VLILFSFSSSLVYSTFSDKTLKCIYPPSILTTNFFKIHLNLIAHSPWCSKGAILEDVRTKFCMYISNISNKVSLITTPVKIILLVVLYGCKIYLLICRKCISYKYLKKECHGKYLNLFIQVT